MKAMSTNRFLLEISTSYMHKYESGQHKKHGNMEKPYYKPYQQRLRKGWPFMGMVAKNVAKEALRAKYVFEL